MFCETLKVSLQELFRLRKTFSEAFIFPTSLPQSSIFPENGDPMGKNFVALDKLRLARESLDITFLLLSKPEVLSHQSKLSSTFLLLTEIAITAGEDQLVCSLSSIPDDSAFFASALQSTDSFDSFNVKALCTQMGSRGVGQFHLFSILGRACFSRLPRRVFLVESRSDFSIFSCVVS